MLIIVHSGLKITGVLHGLPAPAPQHYLIMALLIIITETLKVNLDDITTNGEILYIYLKNFCGVVFCIGSFPQKALFSGFPTFYSYL